MTRSETPDPPPPASVWLAPPKPARRSAGAGAGALSREKVVATAVRLLDADGEDGLSMRKLAAELKVTPMSVYWHVANKDDLLELALDAVAADIELPDPASGSWSDGLRALAHAWRHTMLAHPWALHCYNRYLNIGPHSLRVAECGRAIVTRAPMPPADRPVALAAIFEYVYGATAVEGRWAEHARQVGLSTDAYLAQLARAMAQTAMAQTSGVQTSGVTTTEGMLHRSSGTGGVSRVRDDDFDRALRWLLTGMGAA